MVRSVVVLGGVALVAAGCGGASSGRVAKANLHAATPTTVPGGTTDGRAVELGPADASGPGSAVAPRPMPAAGGASGGSGGASDTFAGPNPTIQTNTVGLRAGSVDDNDRFADYLSYRTDFAKTGNEVHDLDVSERHVFSVVGTDGRPIVGADVQVLDHGGALVAELRTASDGRALWFPKASTAAGTGTAFQAVVTFGSARTTAAVDRSTLTHAVTLPTTRGSGPAALDVEFLVDATGSMGDEIARLDQAIQSISSRVAALASKPDLRFALTAFRDRGDAFVTRTWDFTSDVQAFEKTVGALQADGGGDNPEDVQAGLADAVAKPSWRGPGTVKLLFLIGDAPPHLDYQGETPYSTTAVAAATQGITIESLAASGLDDQGEYVWRQLAELTLGQFLFLTYGADGTSPGDDTTHHVSGYSPKGLDDLVVNLIQASLAAASGAAHRQQQP